MTAEDVARPDAAVVDEDAVARRKEARKQLDAPKGPTTWLVVPEEVVVAGVDYPADPADPFYDERVHLPLDEGMIEDIDQNGVKQPVTVVKDGELPKVDDGRRRVLHARAANVRRAARGEPPLRIKIFLEKGDAKQIFLTARRSNAYRVDDGVLQRARNAERAITRFGATVEEVAKAENTTPKSVKDWLAVLELGTDARTAIEAGQISPAAALKLLRDIPRKDQGKVLAEEVARTGGRVTVRDAEAGAKNAKRDRTPTLPEGDGEQPERAASAPTRGKLRKLLLGLEQGKGKDLGEKDDPGRKVFVGALRWFLGDATARVVPGLSATLRELGL